MKNALTIRGRGRPRTRFAGHDVLAKRLECGASEPLFPLASYPAHKRTRAFLPPAAPKCNEGGPPNASSQSPGNRRRLQTPACVLDCGGCDALPPGPFWNLGLLWSLDAWILDVSATLRPTCLHFHCTLRVPQLYPMPAFASLCQPNQPKNNSRAKHRPNRLSQKHKLQPTSNLLQLKTQNPTLKIHEILHQKCIKNAK